MKSKNTLAKVTGILKKYEKELTRMYEVKRMGIFGSYIRNEDIEASDLDILVEFEEDVELRLQTSYLPCQ